MRVASSGMTDPAAWVRRHADAPGGGSVLLFDTTVLIDHPRAAQPQNGVTALTNVACAPQRRAINIEEIVQRFW